VTGPRVTPAMAEKFRRRFDEHEGRHLLGQRLANLGACLAVGGALCLADRVGRDAIEARVYNWDEHWKWSPGCGRLAPGWEVDRG